MSDINTISLKSNLLAIEKIFIILSSVNDLAFDYLISRNKLGESSNPVAAACATEVGGFRKFQFATMCAFP